MSELARDAGLVRAVGPLALAASTVNCVVGAGIFVAPASLAAAVGSYAPLAVLACAIATGAIVVCFAAGGRRIATSGGPYGYVHSAFGPLAGCTVGTLLWVSDILSSGGIAAALGDGVAALAPATLASGVRIAVVIATLTLVAVINIGGVRWGARFIAVATCMKLLPLLVFLIAGAASFAGWHHEPSATPSMQGFGRAMILGLFTFTGFETALIASGEVQRPQRTIPLALGCAMGFIAVLYVAIQVVAQGMLGPQLASSSAPLADAMAQVNPSLRGLLLAGASVSMFAWLASDMLSTPRVLFAFARDGLMPAALGRVHPRTHTPYVAIGCYAVVAILLACTGTFAELVVMSTLATAAVYVAACAAVWVLTRREAAAAGAAPAAPLLRVAAIVGIASMVLMIALASWAEIGGLGVITGLGILTYAVRRLRLRPLATR